MMLLSFVQRTRNAVHIFWLSLILFTTSCSRPEPTFDWQGHRGARGLMPENTIPAFIKALEYDIKTLELDVVISADNRVIVSHEPFLSPVICTDSLGNSIASGSEMKWNIYQLKSDELSLFDCGSLPHPRFPEQQKQTASKPTLTQVFDAVKAYCDKKGLRQPDYNIELKSSEEGDHIFHPEPSVFCELVFAEIDGKVPLEKLTIQSFDFRILRYFHEHYPNIRLSVLIENEKSAQENLAELGFNPEVYSSYYKTVTAEEVSWLHTAGMKVVPWTVNEVADMKELINLGVDGIITDYPNRISEVAS